MYPHGRSLVTKLDGKPFVIIGVNSDTDRAALKKAVAKEGITWRSFWDGGGTEGPIAVRWNVHSWPAVYVLDGKGVIRYKRPFEGTWKPIEALIERLLEEP